MQKLSNLPIIQLDEITADVTALLDNNQIQFKPLEEAPWALRKFSWWFNEYYLAYKDTIYVPVGHVAIAQSKDDTDRIIATSKLLPWVYAIKNNSVSSIPNFLRTIFNTEIRSYYFLFEYALLKAHGLPEIPELVTTGFLSTRKNILGFRKNPDKVLKTMKSVLNTKILTAD